VIHGIISVPNRDPNLKRNKGINDDYSKCLNSLTQKSEETTFSLQLLINETHQPINVNNEQKSETPKEAETI
jgi:hypothetical protein